MQSRFWTTWPPPFLFRAEMKKNRDSFLIKNRENLTKFYKKEFCFFQKLKFIHFNEVHCNIHWLIHIDWIISMPPKKKTVTVIFSFFFFRKLYARIVCIIGTKKPFFLFIHEIAIFFYLSDAAIEKNVQLQINVNFITRLRRKKPLLGKWSKDLITQIVDYNDYNNFHARL